MPADASSGNALVKRGRTHVMTRGRWWGLCPAAFLCITIAAPAEAQDFRGSIIGTIVDSSGGLLPGVSMMPAQAAATATAPPGWVEVDSAPIPIPPGQAGSGGSISCPPGTVPWGGGSFAFGGWSRSVTPT